MSDATTEKTAVNPNPTPTTGPAANKEPAAAAPGPTFEVTDEHGSLIEMDQLDTGIRIRLGTNPAKIPSAKLRELSGWLQGVAKEKTAELEKAEKAKAAEEKAKAAEAEKAKAAEAEKAKAAEAEKAKAAEPAPPVAPPAATPA